MVETVKHVNFYERSHCNFGGDFKLLLIYINYNLKTFYLFCTDLFAPFVAFSWFNWVLQIVLFYYKLHYGTSYVPLKPQRSTPQSSPLSLFYMLSFISQSQILSSPVCPEGIYLSSCLFKRMESERHCLIVTHSIYNVLALFRQIQFFCTHISFLSVWRTFNTYLRGNLTVDNSFTLDLTKELCDFPSSLEGLCPFHSLVIKYFFTLSFSLLGFWQIITCNCYPCSSAK